MFWAKNMGPEAGMQYDDPGSAPGQNRDAPNLGARAALQRGIRVPKVTGMFVARR